jgi:hypothetical protein
LRHDAANLENDLEAISDSEQKRAEGIESQFYEDRDDQNDDQADYADEKQDTKEVETRATVK